MEMMGGMFIDPGLAKESHEQSPEHVEGRHPGSDGSHQPQQEMAVGTGKGLPEDLVLTEKSREARNSGDGLRGDEKGPKGIGNLFPESSHFSHIQFAAQGVHHTSGAKEEESFEESMGHQMEDSSTECTHSHA